eukprot:Selendium_serpulae@DN6088_c0_g2_i4.p1
MSRINQLLIFLCCQSCICDANFSKRPFRSTQRHAPASMLFLAHRSSSTPKTILRKSQQIEPALSLFVGGSNRPLVDELLPLCATHGYLPVVGLETDWQTAIVCSGISSQDATTNVVADLRQIRALFQKAKDKKVTGRRLIFVSALGVGNSKDWIPGPSADTFELEFGTLQKAEQEIMAQNDVVSTIIRPGPVDDNTSGRLWLTRGTHFPERDGSHVCFVCRSKRFRDVQQN